MLLGEAGRITESIPTVAREVFDVSGAGDADRSQFYRNWQAIVGEVGERYGEKLHGWFFDGGQRYYDCHFDNTPYTGLTSAPFQVRRSSTVVSNPPTGSSGKIFRRWFFRWAGWTRKRDSTF